MERDSAWLFLDAGRRLERAQSLVRLLRSVLVDKRAGVVEDLLVESLLKTSESLIVFRRRSGPIMQVAGAVDLLVYDVANPRSVIYQLDRLVHAPGRPAQAVTGPAPGQRGAPGPRDHHHAAADRRRPPGRPWTRTAGAGPSSTPCFAGWTGCWPICWTACGRPTSSHERLSVLAGLQHEACGRGP